MHICVRCKYTVNLTKLAVSRDTMVRITRHPVSNKFVLWEINFKEGYKY